MTFLAPWAIPFSLAMVVGAWQAWPGENRAGAIFVLGLSVASLWASTPEPALLLGLTAVFLTVRLRQTWFEEALALPLLFSVLLRARITWLPVLPPAMSVWGGLLALLGVCLASQGLVVATSSQDRRRAIGVGQGAWAAFGLVTGSPLAPMAWTGLLGLLWQQPLLRQPLSAAMERQDLPPWRTAVSLLGLGGCVGLSGFSAYFQLFVPLMGQAGAGALSSKLGDSAGWLVAVAMLAVLVQTAAFGYFYWLTVLHSAIPEAEASPTGRWQSQGPWLALALSLLWAFNANTVSGWALRSLQVVSPTFQSP